MPIPEGQGIYSRWNAVWYRAITLDNCLFANNGAYNIAALDEDDNSEDGSSLNFMFEFESSEFELNLNSDLLLILEVALKLDAELDLDI